jgi:hypothetical protein
MGTNQQSYAPGASYLPGALRKTEPQHTLFFILTITIPPSQNQAPRIALYLCDIYYGVYAD